MGLPIAPKYHYHSDNSYERVYLNEFGRHLRDQADGDYIASRALYRRHLVIHSANLAHQSIEKYLKAILLFLEQNTRPFGHDLKRLLNRNLELGLILNEKSIEAVNLLHGLHNVSRYQGSGSYSIDHSFLFYLDYFVRDIRPWVQNRNIRDEVKIHSNPKKIVSGHQYRTGRIFMSGHLEKVINGNSKKYERVRQDLIWNNPYFGARSKNKIQFFRGSTSRNIPFNLNSKNHLKLAQHMRKYFKFEPEIEEYLKQNPCD